MRSFLVASAACMLACDRGTTQGNARLQADAFWRNPAATLVVLPFRDTLNRGDSVVLFTEIRNGREPRTIRNDVELLEFSVMGPNGKALAAQREPYQEWNLGDRPIVHLPRGGVTGMAVNLTCLTQPYAPVAQAGVCMRGYDFNAPGQYEITVRYADIRVEVPGLSAESPLQLQAGPVRIFVR